MFKLSCKYLLGGQLCQFILKGSAKTKVLKRLFSLLLVICLSVSVVSAKSIITPEITVQEYTIVSTYTVDSSTTCSHDNTIVRQGAQTGEDCYYRYYNFTEVCLNPECRAVIRGGTLALSKDTPTHTFQIVSVDCVGGTHTYEERCSKCNYANRSFSRPCNGNCAEWNSLPDVIHSS